MSAAFVIKDGTQNSIFKNSQSRYDLQQRL